jgi:hypothetical protein
MMDRRRFLLTSLAGALVAPLAAVLPARARARWYKLLTPRKGKRHV